jgi:hypothetical protein
MIDWERFVGLNLESLFCLGLEDVEGEDIKQFLDIVLESDPKELAMSFTSYALSSLYTVLSHDLLRRVMTLRIQAGQ